MQPTDDGTLLRQYAEDHSDEAFATLVSRHINLVYSVALRQVGDSHEAEEIAQAVFIILAKKAAQLRHDKALSSWLFQTTRLTASNFVRSEGRRHRREQEAHMQSVLNESGGEIWPRIAPHLDDAVAALSEADRHAIMLRFYEGRTLREVGSALGASEDAAEKRVGRAIEQLREFFAKRGITVGAGALVGVVSANAVQAAPVSLAITISNAAALAGTTIATAATSTATNAIAMTTLQKTFVTVTLFTAVGTGIYEARQASMFSTQVQALQQQQWPLTKQVRQLTTERDEAAVKLAALRDENERLSQNTVELARLRSEVARLRTTQHQVAQLQDANDPFMQSVLALAARAGELNQQLERMPDMRIPELQFLTESDWLTAARETSFQSDAEIRQALSRLRSLAKNKFGVLAAHALDKFIEANNGELPGDPTQLKPYFEVPVDDATLERYQMLHTGKMSDLPKDNAWVMSEKSPVDRDYDSHLYVGPKGRSGSWATGKGETGDPDEAWATRQ